jgi:hypothetical protein
MLSLMATPQFLVLVSWLVFCVFIIGVLTLLVLRDKMDVRQMCVIVLILLFVSQTTLGKAIEDLQAYFQPPAAAKPIP